MYKDFRLKLEKVVDALGEIIAFVAVVVYAFLILNANFAWVTDPTALKVLGIIDKDIAFVLIAVTGFECVIKRNIIIRIIFYLLLAVIIIFMFFPGTYNTMISWVPTAA